ncbi:UDP-glucose 4-epimerase GalE [Candidatus Saccharibacteria bacterium]|nr:UDP-glucose 4-epimerase GalE [Candidatus Saccharibacteria bacterium]
MKVLLTGGTGFIGSHAAVRLIELGHDVEILDNLVNSKVEVLDKIKEITGVKPGFHQVDLLDYEAVREVFKDGGYDLVIHFAGLKAVGESVEKPLLYYENNIEGTINLLKCMRESGVKKIIFSSSATVYGDTGETKFTEEMPVGVKISNPYGKTKYMIEEILRDEAVADEDLEVVILRYFNPIGAHESGLLGEDPNDIPNNLMPIIMKVARGEIKELKIYGDDYETVDGTGVRDYIHVVDLVDGHLAAIKKMKPGVLVYNLGTGRGTSVLEMVKMFEKASGEKLPYEIVGRREGDLGEVIANADKAKKELDWTALRTIEDAMRDTLNYLSQN